MFAILCLRGDLSFEKEKLERSPKDQTTKKYFAVMLVEANLSLLSKIQGSSSGSSLEPKVAKKMAFIVGETACIHRKL